MESRRNEPSFELLRAADELRLAEEIEARDVELWTALLSYSPATSVALREIDSALPEEAPPHRELQRCAAWVSKTHSPRARRRLSRAARDFAQLLRPLDRDRVVRRKVLRRLNTIDRNHGELPTIGLRRSSRRFRTFLTTVRSLDRAGSALRERFIHANLRLVMSVARTYRNVGIPYADLVQEGNLGLIKAVDRFDHRRGTRFSTFAVWWIRHTIGRAVADKSRLVRIPVHLSDNRRRLAGARGAMAAELGRSPTRDELAARLAIEPAHVERLERQSPEIVMSLDSSTVDSTRAWYDSFLDFTEQPSFVQKLVDAAIADRLDDLLETLRPIEADVLRKRFGLDGGVQRTLRDIAQEYGLSRERIRQIEKAALASLRDRLEPPHER
jgi:RNA polymerase primary sigma factor